MIFPTLTFECNSLRDPDISEVSEEAHSVMVPLQPVSRPPPDIQLGMPPLVSDSDTSDSGSSSGFDSFLSHALS